MIFPVAADGKPIEIGDIQPFPFQTDAEQVLLRDGGLPQSLIECNHVFAMSAGYGTQPWKPLRMREHNTFLSHAHVNRRAVENLFDWLENKAGLTVWYDAAKMSAGEQFASALVKGIGDSQSMLVAISKESLASEWVNREADAGINQQVLFKKFRVIPVRLEPCALPPNLFTHSAVDAFDGRLDGPEAARLLRGIHGVADLATPASIKQQVIQSISSLAGDPVDPFASAYMPVLYVTCGWRDSGNEPMLRRSTCDAFVSEHFYLIGDAEDHQHTLEARIRSIMSGCSGHLIIIPKRADSFGDPAYKSLRSELAIGKGLGLPQFVVAESRLDFPAGDVTAFLDLQISDKPGESEIESRLTSWAQDVRETCKPPIGPQFVFVATDYDDLVMKEHVVRHMSQITGLPCLKGNDFGRQIPARKIEFGIRKASMVIANIVSSTAPSGDPIVNLNTCVEAGIAMGAQRQVHMIARRPPTDRWKLDNHLPFVIRHNTVETYGDDQDLIGLVHRFARPFRRRIINVEGVP